MPTPSKPITIALTSRSENETRRVGRILGKLAQPGQVFALLGELGAGKTRLAQGFGAGLDVPPTEVINSPTFTFVNQYQGRLTCYHIDLYRLATTAEAETLGLDDYFYDDGVCLVEWANRLSSGLPDERLEVELQYQDDTTRGITLRGYGDEFVALLQQFAAIAPGTEL